MLQKITEFGPALLNTILLVGMFWYQHVKNKVLTDRISEQSSLLAETKGLIDNQTLAIEGQKAVMDTALDYSKSFDPSKLEAVIRREVEIDYKELISDKEKELSEHKEFTKEHAMEIALMSADYTIKKMVDEYVVDLYKPLYIFLLKAEQEEREEIYKEMKGPLVVDLRNSVEKFHKNIPRGLQGFAAIKTEE